MSSNVPVMMKRAANVSAAEKAILVELVERYAHIVENKLTDRVTTGQKAAAWKQIEADFLGIAGVRRTDEQLKQVGLTMHRFIAFL